jgi:hypothetical protein
MLVKFWIFFFFQFTVVEISGQKNIHIVFFNSKILQQLFFNLS